MKSFKKRFSQTLRFQQHPFIQGPSIRKAHEDEKRVLFLINHLSFFVSHRIDFAKRAINDGHQVILVAGHAGSVVMEKSAEKIFSSLEIPLYKVSYRSSSMNPLREIISVLQIVSIFIKTQPDLIYCSSPKAVLYGGIAARIAGIKASVYSITGMGFLFTERNSPRRNWELVIKNIYQFLIKFILKSKNSWVIVENKTDMEYFKSISTVGSKNIILIRGSGVDLKMYKNAQIENKEDLVVLPARLLRDKGVIEFVEAVKIIKSELKYVNWRFALAGTADYANPTSIPEETVSGWVRMGIIEWFGHVDDMVPIYEKASIICLPSYREGLSKSLLEGGAAGCAIVTTDAVGCRDAIIPGQTGEIVPVGNAKALAISLIKLMDDKSLREFYGRNGRRFVSENFSLEDISCQTLSVFKRALDSRN